MLKLKEWLQKHTLFMNEVTFLAQIGHVLAGNLVVMTTAFFCGSQHWVLALVACLMVMYAAFKEYWFDANYEIPKQTSFDNNLDFSMYMLGLVIGCVEVFFKWYF